MRKKLLITSLLLTLVGVSASFKPILQVEALSARSINITNASTSTVRSYYSGLNSLSESQRKGDALLTNLKPILKSGHSTFNYATVWDWTKVTDRDWSLSPMTQAQLNSYNFGDDPYVKLLYRSDNGTSTASKHSATHGTVIDREHVWPKSLGNFGESAPAGTDLHHLILADSKNNQQGHSNYPYGNVNPSSYTAIATYIGNFTGKRGSINYSGKSYTVYEPQDQDKGDIARAMFYMAARYSSYTSNSDPYLKLSNTPHTTTFTSSASNPGQAGFLSTLLQWHELDPVDDYEIRRNNLIYNNAQFNRNPFIDYPSWVNAVWGGGAAASPANDDVSQFGQTVAVVPTAITLSPSSLSLNVGGSQTLSVNVTPSNASKSVTWTSSNNSVASVSSSGTVNALKVGTATITAKSTLNTSIQGTATINVSTAPTLGSISISNYETSVKLMGDYDTSNIVVTAHYSNGSTANVKSSAIIETPDTSRLGSQSLTVSYTENGISKFTTYDVFVTNNGVHIGNVSALATDLFISEYVEGSSNNKYLEIFNGTGQSVNLSDYRLQLFANGASTPNNDVALSGTLANNSTIVYKHSSAALTLPSGVTATANSALNYNGNDAIGLYKTSTSSYVDVFGIIGNNPGTAWTGGGVSTLNKTLVRKPSVYQGVTVNPDTFDPSVEWIQYPVDTATYLGSHTMTATLPGTTKEIQANAWAEYFLDTTSVYCEDLNGNSLAGLVWTELGREYSYMDVTTKALYASTLSNAYSEGVPGAKARYHFLVTKYDSLMSNNFMRDGNNNIIFSVNKLDSESNNQKSWVVIIVLFLSAILSSTYLFLNKKRSIFNQ
jgi:endonuclease I